MDPIPYGRQHITDKDIEAVVSTLQSTYLTQGPKIDEFEEAFAKYIGVKFAVAIANGTAALHLSTLVLGVKEGDKVITTPITFAASANCVRYCGGEVVFTDIDPDTYLLEINQVQQLLDNSPKGTYKGIIPVDFTGRAVNMEAFKELADEYGLWIIEDACHAPGGYFVDSQGIEQNCGNGAYADLAIFSFHPVKHIAAGEGGMITTNDEVLYQKLLKLRTHGITKNQAEFQNSIDFALGESHYTSGVQRHPDLSGTQDYPGWYMEMQELGFNYRITDFQCALGTSQLKRAEESVNKRRKIARTYQQAFLNKPYVINQSGVVDGHAYHLYIIEVKNRFDLYNYLRKNNIFTQIHYIPCHLMPYYRQLGWKEGDLAHSEQYYRQCISLPMFPTLNEDEQEFIIDKIDNFYK